jgi:hypothetical protein
MAQALKFKTITAEASAFAKAVSAATADGFQIVGAPQFLAVGEKVFGALLMASVIHKPKKGNTKQPT